MVAGVLCRVQLMPIDKFMLHRNYIMAVITVTSTGMPAAQTAAEEVEHLIVGVTCGCVERYGTWWAKCEGRQISNLASMKSFSSSERQN